MIEGIDEWKRGGTIERSSVVKGSGDTHRRLIHIWDAEIDFSHDDSFRKIAVMKGACFRGSSVQRSTNTRYRSKYKQAYAACLIARDVVWMSAAFEMRLADGFDVGWLGG